MVYSLRSARRGSRQAASQGLVLDPTDGLHLVGVSLGAELVVVSVLALVSVSLQDVLVTTVTGELVGHPAAGEERGRNEVNKEVLGHGWNVENISTLDKADFKCSSLPPLILEVGCKSNQRHHPIRSREKELTLRS